MKNYFTCSSSYQLHAFIHHHSTPCFIGHLQAHINLSVPLMWKCHPSAATEQVFVLQQAQYSHALHHQNADTLEKQFGFSREAEHQSVHRCTLCP
jgi:hypothetical protein